MTFKSQNRHVSILADVLTPVSMYLRLRDKYPGSILLESNEYNERSNSYSFICCNPVASIKVDNKTLFTQLPDGTDDKTTVDNNFNLIDHLQAFKDKFNYTQENTPYPTQGMFGYISYDAVQYFEDIELRFRESVIKHIPQLHYQVFKNVIVLDHYHNKVHIYDHDYKNEGDLIQEIKDIIEHRDITQYSFSIENNEKTEFTDHEYEELVRKGMAHCQRGDVFQVVLSRKFTQKFKGDDFQVYRHLRAINPSPYLFYFDYGDYKLMGSSPEAQLLIKDNIATIQPIAGTYKRTGNDSADYAAAQNLKNDPKEKAEHVMLVDLARNDLSRHATNVAVQDYQNIHFYSHVIHMVSKVTGQIAYEDRLPLVADTFPAGTLSGAPKFRAMQLIDQYEMSSREFYGGAIGYMGFDGTFNHAILIRSILSRNNYLEYRAGAGIVINSEPVSELNEIYNKTNALRMAIKNANDE